MAQMWFVDPRPQGHSIFLDFMILIDSTYDPGESEVLLVKIGDRVLDLWLDMSFGPKWPEFSF